MITFFLLLLQFISSDSLKIWIPNTNINNRLNWDKKDTPKECDNIRFESQIEIAVFWNLKVVVTGLSLPQTGDLIFPNNVNIQFRNKENCLFGRDLKYIRHEVKGWLDPDNWKSDSEYQWLPHSERVPCAGESILFPPQGTFAVQLPSILVPIGEINFDGEVFIEGDSWSDFLKSDLGFQIFKGPDDVRSAPWRNDIECLNDKKCTCGRSSYTIREGLYRSTEPFIFEEAVCLYAMSKCKPSACYSPIIPEGHCCGICGAVIKIEDNTKEGMNITALKAKVEEELEKQDLERKLKVYVGRTKDENIQIVVVAENPDDTIKSHIVANSIKRNLFDQKFQAKISSRVSGLRFSNYLFNSVSGVVFGSLMTVLALFVFIYYIYLVLPRKKFQSSDAGNPFMFARFENTANEGNLQIGVQPEASDDLPHAFENPVYSKNSEPGKDCSKAGPTNLQTEEGEILQTSEPSSIKEYFNPVYSELVKTKKLDKFLDQPRDDEEEFSEIKF